MNRKTSTKQPLNSPEQPDASLGIDSRLIIHRGYFDGPFGTGSFTIDVGHEFSGQLVQLIPIPAAGKSCTVSQISSEPVLGTNHVKVTYQIQGKGDLVQLAYTLFVTS